MYMPKLLVLPALFCCMNVEAHPVSPGLGRPATYKIISNWNHDVFPDGQGLPEGQGDAVAGEKVYQQHCQSCHGIEATGGSAEELAGASHSLTDNPPDKTIGTYWPYATTVFDFIRRSMPMDAPGILNNNQIYAVTAYLLYLNGIIRQKDEMNASSLPLIEMPNRKGFIPCFRSL